FRVNPGVKIVLLAPKGVRWIEILEVLYKPCTIELSMAEVADKGSQPAAPNQTASVAHGIFTAHAGPIGERRSGNNDRADQFRSNGCHHHHRPSGLTVANNAWLAICRRMQIDDPLEKHGFCARHILDGLTGYGLRQEADEVAWMPGFEGYTNLAIGLETPNPGAMSRARVHDHERAARRVCFNRLRRNDPHQRIVDGSLKRPPIDDELNVIVEHVWRGLGQMLTELISALTHDVQEQDAPLCCIDQILECRRKKTKGLRELVIPIRDFWHCFRP